MAVLLGEAMFVGGEGAGFYGRVIGADGALDAVGIGHEVVHEAGFLAGCQIQHVMDHYSFEEYLADRQKKDSKFVDPLSATDGGSTTAPNRGKGAGSDEEMESEFSLSEEDNELASDQEEFDKEDAKKVYY